MGEIHYQCKEIFKGGLKMRFVCAESGWRKIINPRQSIILFYLTCAVAQQTNTCAQGQSRAIRKRESLWLPLILR